MGKRVAALDIGGTRIKAALFENNAISSLCEIATDATAGAADVLRRAGDLLEPLRPFDAIGISTAGQVDVATGCIRYANSNMPGYTGTDVYGIFKARFGVPVAVLNDVYAAGTGEGIHGAAIGELDYICITYGTGIGGGVFLNGKPYYGAGHSAGVMLGGLITHPERITVEDAFSGTYERSASATALVATAKALDPALENGRLIFEHISNPQVHHVVDCWLDEVAVGLCTLIHTFNIPFLVLGGGVMEQPYAIHGAIERVEQRVIPGFRGVTIAGAKLGNAAGLYGAYHMASAK